MTDRIWATFWSIVIICMCGTIAFSVSSCQQTNRLENAQIQQLVEQGKSPIAARCAVKGFDLNHDALICQAAILKGGN